MSVRLIALNCVQCRRPLRPQPEEVAFVCPDCGAGTRLADDGPAPLAVSWAAARPGPAPSVWLPFWSFAGAVQVTRRVTQRGDTGPDPLWATARRLWVPAFPQNVDQAQQLGVALTRAQPNYPPAAMPQGAELQRCVIAVDDARRLAEFVVLSIEAARSDMLKDLEFVLPAGDPELWWLPSNGRELIAA